MSVNAPLKTRVGVGSSAQKMTSITGGVVPSMSAHDPLFPLSWASARTQVDPKRVATTTLARTQFRRRLPGYAALPGSLEL